MDASVLHHFDKTSDSFFDPRLLDVRGEDVQRLTLYSQHGVQWDMTLWRLKELRFEDEPVARLGYPAAQRLVLDLLGGDGKVLSSFSFFTDPRLPADQCWLKVGTEEMYYPVSNQLLEDVQGYLPARQQKAAEQ